MARYDAPTVDNAAGVGEWIPDLIIPQVVQTAVENECFMPLTRRFDLTGAGAVFSIPQAGALAWGTLTNDGTEPTEKLFDCAVRTLTPVPHFLDVVIPFIVDDASAVDLQTEIAKEAAIGLADYRDTLLATLYSDRPTSTPDHFYGTENTEINFSTLRACQNLLYVQKAPKPFAWVVHPQQFTELLKDDTFINAGVKGSPVLTKGVGGDGFATKVIDVNVYVAEQIVDSTGHHSMMFSSNAALAYGYKLIGKPGASKQEIMMDVEWDSTRRTIEINMTIHAVAGGAKGTAAAENTWLVDIIS